MKISDFQTMDYILKSSVLTRPPYLKSNVKLLLKCDDFLVYGDLIQVEDDSVYEFSYDSLSNKIKQDSFGPSLDSPETKQINSFKKISQPFGNDLVKSFSYFINSKYDLEILFDYLVALVNDLQEANDLPNYLYSATFINVPNLSVLPKIDLNSFSSVKLISLFEAPQR